MICIGLAFCQSLQECAVSESKPESFVDTGGCGTSCLGIAHHSR